MRTGSNRHWLAGVTGTALAGALVFFIVIGVFGERFAIGGLLAFVLGALAIYRTFPAEGV
jgi:hypothetical protein